jgi:hypothetical protein
VHARVELGADLGLETTRAGVDEERELLALAQRQRLADERGEQRGGEPGRQRQPPEPEPVLHAGASAGSLHPQSFPGRCGCTKPREELSWTRMGSQGLSPQTLAPRALIVDDEPEHLEAMQALVESQGFATRTATSLVTARTALEEENFDLLITDLQLPTGHRWICFP